MIPNTIPLIGYADRWSARPGETVAFKVSSRSAEPYRARMVRVISADPNPAGPGIKEEAVASDIEGSWPSAGEGRRTRLLRPHPGRAAPGRNPDGVRNDLADAAGPGGAGHPVVARRVGRACARSGWRAGRELARRDGGRCRDSRRRQADALARLVPGMGEHRPGNRRGLGGPGGAPALRPGGRHGNGERACGRAPRRDRGGHLRRGGRRKPGRRPFQRQDRTAADHAGRRAGRRYRRRLGLLARNLLPPGRSMRGRTAGTASL